MGSLKFSWWAPKEAVFWHTVRNGPSRSCKVVNFGTNRKRVCDFLLVINSNLGPILPRFRDMQVSCWERPHPYSTRILGLYPWTTNDVVTPRSEDPKLITRVINFELAQPICPCTVHQRHGRTDRRTDGRTTYDSNTELALYVHRAVRTPTQSFGDNFGKYGPILIILLSLHFVMNSGRSFYIICHLF